METAAVVHSRLCSILQGAADGTLERLVAVAVSQPSHRISMMSPTWEVPVVTQA